MIFARLKHAGAIHHARIDGHLAALFDRAPWDGGTATGEVVSFSPEDLECPVTPSKILCVGRNYAAHAAELGNEVPQSPLWFSKPPSALLANGGSVLLPPESQRVEHEGELAVVIGRRVRRASAESALDAVFGYTIACDVTARDLQKSDGQWTRAKGFDTFCPVGPYVTTGVDPAALGIRVSVDGGVRQDGNTRQMVFQVADLVAHASAMMTLEPGDLILTGTPEGVGPLVDGNHCVVEIDALGRLEFGVRREQL